MKNKYQEQKDYAIGLLESNCHFTAPEVIEGIDKTLQELIDKDSPKKVITIEGRDSYKCPNCGCDNTDYGIMYDGFITFSHCSQCGQALDWSDCGD